MGFANLSISVHIVQPEKCREALTEHSKEVFFVTLWYSCFGDKQKASISSVVNLTYFIDIKPCLK